MVDPFGTDSNPPIGSGAERARDELNARFQHLRHDTDQGESAQDRATGPFDGTPHASSESRGPQSAAANFKAQASQAASEAKGAAVSIAEQARSRLAEVVDQQKSAGADRIAGVAQAARSAATELDKTSPELARLVRSAADSVDGIASDVRGRDVGDVLDTVATLGRRQPVAFFGGAVLTGFLLARFFKSDAPVVTEVTPHRGPA